MTLRPWSLLLLAAALAACGDSAAPDRSDRYGYQILNRSDTLAFHWNGAELPVRIWVENNANLPAQVQRAITVWKNVLGGQYDAIEVNDSSTAKVIVHAQPINAAPSLIPIGSVACQGLTQIDTVATEFQLSIPIRISIETLGDPASDSVQACVRRVTAHELGHSLGLFQHSPNPGDLMYSTPLVDAPSTRDDNTVNYLYSVVRNMIPTAEATATPKP